MKVHAILDHDSLHRAGLAESIGFDGVSVTETVHDPFLSLMRCTAETSRVCLATAIAVAFPRSPWHLAQTANDLQTYSQGRFMLGLGSQVRAHVERRFSAAFDRPVPRMRELILAVRAIWRAWAGDAPLRFEGEFYRHTLLTPFFDPGPNPHGNPPIMLAAVGASMVRVAGEVADGLLVHGFSTPRYLREVTLPAFDDGLRTGGRTRPDVEIARPVFLVTGRDAAETAAAKARVQSRLAFYGATPAYRGVLELQGWGDLQPELAALAREGREVDMMRLIDDDVLEAFAVVGQIDDIPKLVAAHYGGIVDRLSFNVAFHDDPERWGALIEAIHAIPGGADRV